MRPVRIVAGMAMFVVSAWSVPMAADLLGMSEPLVFATFGSIMAFIGGMVLHSGVGPSVRYRW